VDSFFGSSHSHAFAEAAGLPAPNPEQDETDRNQPCRQTHPQPDCAQRFAKT